MPNSRTLLVRGARQLITLRGPKEPRRGESLSELGIIADGSLLIRGGILEEVGPTRRVENLAMAREAEEINAAGCVVMPGLIDAHTHLVYPQALGTAAIDDDEDLLLQAEARSLHQVTAKRLESRCRDYVETMLRHGTTMLEAKTGCGPDESAEMKVLRVLAALDCAPTDVVATCLVKLNGDPEVARFYEELIDKVGRRKLVKFVEIECEEGAESTANPVVEMAHRLGLPLGVHHDGSGRPGAAQRATEWGAVKVSHLDYPDRNDLDMLSSTGTMVTLTPAVNFHDRSRHYAPARQLIDEGAAVALGSNFNPVSTPTLNMQTVMALACTQLRMTPAEALTAATINAAHALRCADRVGSLEFGKAADFLILDTPDYRDAAHGLGSNLVRTTVKGGAVVYEQGTIRLPDLDDLKRAG